MMAAEIFRDWRAGMIAGATVLHLTALAGAWALMPPGTETRLNRPIEASFAPAPSSDAVNMNSAPLASEVVSTNTVTEAAELEDTASVVPPDAVKTDTFSPDQQRSARPDAVAIQASPPVPQSAVSPDEAMLEAATERVVPEQASPPAATATPPQQMAALAPDVLTTASPDDNLAVPLMSPSVEPAQDAPDSPSVPAVEKPKPQKPEQPKKVRELKRKTEPSAKSAPAKTQPQESRFANLDTTTKIKRVQKGGQGSISDIGMADDARISGASVQAYAAILRAAVMSRMRAMGDIGCQGGAHVKVGAVISAQGRISSVRLMGASGDSALDRAALSAVRSASLTAPPPKAVPAIIPLSCPRS
ncbi:TonB family protein [Labrys okinawensis]|uniref:TonB family protein n=1 Tax=Labrys okinawensis TaxID=346911 RepID=UPI0039BCE2CE